MKTCNCIHTHSCADTYTDLLLHGYAEQDDEVQNENRPEHGDVEEIKHRTQHANQQRLQCAIPDNRQRMMPHYSLCDASIYLVGASPVKA